MSKNTPAQPDEESTENGQPYVPQEDPPNEVEPVDTGNHHEPASLDPNPADPEPEPPEPKRSSAKRK